MYVYNFAFKKIKTIVTSLVFTVNLISRKCKYWNLTKSDMETELNIQLASTRSPCVPVCVWEGDR